MAHPTKSIIRSVSPSSHILSLMVQSQLPGHVDKQKIAVLKSCAGGVTAAAVVVLLAAPLGHEGEVLDNLREVLRELLDLCGVVPLLDGLHEDHGSVQVLDQRLAAQIKIIFVQII